MAHHHGTKMARTSLSTLTQILWSISSLRQLNIQTIKHAMAQLRTSSQRFSLLHLTNERQQNVQNQQKSMDHCRRILPWSSFRLVQIQISPSHHWFHRFQCCCQRFCLLSLIWWTNVSLSWEKWRLLLESHQRYQCQGWKHSQNIRSSCFQSTIPRSWQINWCLIPFLLVWCHRLKNTVWK